MNLKDINSGNIALYGKRVLTMANQEGKGWFAIQLGGKINFRTIIPGYILDAVVFAKDEYSLQVIVQMVRYRLEQLEVEKEKIQDLLEYDTLVNLITELKAVIPGDQLITFLEKINAHV